MVECLEPPVFPDVATCMQECLDGRPMMASCVEASLAVRQCRAEMTCEALQTSVFEHDHGECTALQEAQTEACACDGFIIGTDEQCSIVSSCPGQPSVEIHCNEEVCACVVDGFLGEACLVEGFCAMDLVDRFEFAEDCCGFSFLPSP